MASNPYSYRVWAPTAGQSTKAFHEMREAAQSGDIDATCALAVYSALAQITERLDRITEAMARNTEGSNTDGKELQHH